MTKKKPSVPTGERILVVDDESIFRLLLRRILTTEGYVVDAAADGVEAENLLRQQQYDVILLDLMIPEISGIDVLKFIRKRDPSVITIIVTGNSDINAAIECIKLGATDYIVKPIEPEQMLSRIRVLLEENAVEHDSEFDERLFMTRVFNIINVCLENATHSLDRLSHEMAGSLNEQERHTIATLSNTLHHTLIMTADILELSKCETSGFALSKAPTDFNALIEAVCQRFLLLAREKNITLHWTFQDELEPVTLNSFSIERVLTTILHHAIYSTDENGSIMISSVRSSSPRHGIMVTVKDNGKGIPQEEIPTLFEKYQEPSSGTPPESCVNRLGLILCKQLIKSHKGEIWATSEPLNGSAIHFILPI